MASANYNLGKILKERRSEKKMSLREFSEYLSISHAYLSKLEKGVDPRTGKPITPTIETLTKLAEGLKIPMEEFLDMCGYFEGDLLSPAQESPVELADLVTEFMSSVFGQEQLVVNGEKLSGDRELRLAHVRQLLDRF